MGEDMSNTSNSIEPRLDSFKRDGKAAVYPSWERLKSQDDGRRMSLIASSLLRFGRLLPIRDEVKEGPQREQRDSVEADKLVRFIAHFTNNTNTQNFYRKRVIEIGAGPGNQTPLIAQLSPELLVSVEPHPEFVRIAKKYLQ